MAETKYIFVTGGVVSSLGKGINNMEHYDDFFSVRRSWSKGTLAMMYFPDARSVKSATNRLARWMKLCVGLLPALQETGYTPKQKRLTPRQVEIIFYYLGEPGE